MLSEDIQGHIAAVDLGSNSFHMVIGRVFEGQVQILDRIREPVRLAAGLQSDRELDEASQERAIQCLERFAQRIGELDSTQVRAVGTNTLRKARNAYAFRTRASETLGHPIEVLPGREEARLIYLGVAHTSFQQGSRHLVIDIGGGSTEFIIGESLEPIEADSLYMGCVGYSQEFFPKGKLSARRFRAARLAAALELQPIENRYLRSGWDDCIGSSGTIKAVGEIVRANGWGDGVLTLDAIDRLIEAMIAAGHIDDLDLAGLDADRKPVLAGGVAILAAAFERLSLESMRISNGALREGILYDLVGRIQHQDTREKTIQNLCTRYSVDLPQAERVERTALELLAQVQSSLESDPEPWERMLSWASRLHEIGLAVNYTGYHKHGAYLITNSDMPGFSRGGQELLGALVRGHRRKVPRDLFKSLGSTQSTQGALLCAILRIAVLLNRSRSTDEVPTPKVRLKGERLKIEFDESWLEAHTLTRADLELEAKYLEALDISLVTATVQE